MFPDYGIPRDEDDNGNFLHISSAVILRIRLRSAVFKTIFLLADYFSVEVLTSASFKNRHIDSDRCSDRQIEFNKGKIPLLESAPKNLIVRG